MTSQNPARFQKITSQIADKLQVASNTSRNPVEASALSQLASHFATASQSGKFSDLFAQSFHSMGSAQASGAASSSGAQTYTNNAASSAVSSTVGNIFSQALGRL